jgi:quercetin dioxygenase-like cupin family protein
MKQSAFLAVAIFGLCMSAPAPAADKPRQALALKVEIEDDKAKVTVAFNYTGKPGDPPTFSGIRLDTYRLPMDKVPRRVGSQAKEGLQVALVAGQKFTYVPAQADRQENGSLAIVKVAGGKVRLTGVYHAYGMLFVVDETAKPGDPVLLEAGNVPAKAEEKPAGPDEHGKGKVKVTTLSERDVTEKLDGKLVKATVVEVRIEPGEGSPPHRHAGPVFGYVLEGEYEWGLNDQPVKTLKVGDTFYEPKGSLHRVSRNPNAKTRTRVLAVVLHPRDAKQITIPEPSAKKE